MKDQFKYIPQHLPNAPLMGVRHGSGFYGGHRPREPDIGYLIKCFTNK